MSNIDEATLLKLAEEEILGETKRAIVRYSTAGPSGWKPVPKTNKSLLVNTLLQTLSSNRILTRKHESEKQSKKSERKLLQIDRKQLKNINVVYKKPDSCKTITGKNKQTDSKNKKDRNREYKLKKKKKVND